MKNNRSTARGKAATAGSPVAFAAPRPFLPGPEAPMRNPGLPRERLLELHRFLVLNRMIEEKLSALFRQGKITCGLYSSLGQEASSVGSAYALAPEDLL